MQLVVRHVRQGNIALKKGPALRPGALRERIQPQREPLIHLFVKRVLRERMREMVVKPAVRHVLRDITARKEPLLKHHVLMAIIALKDPLRRHRALQERAMPGLEPLVYLSVAHVHRECIVILQVQKIVIRALRERIVMLLQVQLAVRRVRRERLM